MKKTTLLLFLIFWVGLLFAQRPKGYDLTYQMIHDEKERNAYFDRSKNDKRYLLIDEQKFGWNPINKKWYLTDSITYSYNTNGAITEAIFFEWRGRQWRENKRYLHLYNPDGNLILYATQVWKKGTWRQQNGDEQELYKYDENGKMRECLLQKWEGKKWKTYKRILKTYYEDTGLLKSRLDQIDEKGRGKFTNRVRREYLKYDNSERALSWIYQKWDAGGKKQSTRMQLDRSLNQSGLNSLIYEKTLKDNKVIEKKQILYTYDDQDRSTEILAEKWNEGKEEWEVYTISRYIYDDENGIKVLEVYKVNEQTDLVEIKLRNIFYINEDNFIDNETLMLNDKDGKLVKNIRYEYQQIRLEDVNKLQVMLYKRWDTQRNEWINYSLNKYTYQKNISNDH